MNRLIYVITAAGLAASLGACGSQQSSDPTTQSPTAWATPINDTTCTQWNDEMGIVQRITMATDILEDRNTKTNKAAPTKVDSTEFMELLWRRCKVNQSLRVVDAAQLVFISVPAYRS